MASLKKVCAWELLGANVLKTRNRASSKWELNKRVKQLLPIILGVNILVAGGGGGDDGDLFRWTKLTIITHTVDEDRQPTMTLQSTMRRYVCIFGNRLGHLAGSCDLITKDTCVDLL